MSDSPCILLSHVFIDKLSLEYKAKLKQVEFSIRHFRTNNPNSYIILTGHGYIPKKFYKLCDYVYWEKNIDKNEVGKGHPRFVNIGLDHAIKMKFKYILKSRADSIFLIPNFFNWCIDKLGNKKYLVTQQSFNNNSRLGDLFVFGETEFFKKCWKLENWYNYESGLEPHAVNFIENTNSRSLVEAINKDAVYLNIYTLKWICFNGKGNWSKLRFRKKSMLKNKIRNFEKYLWGTSEKWHVWNSNGDLINYSEEGLILESHFKVNL